MSLYKSICFLNHSENPSFPSSFLSHVLGCFASTLGFFNIVVCLTLFLKPPSLPCGCLSTMWLTSPFSSPFIQQVSLCYSTFIWGAHKHGTGNRLSCMQNVVQFGINGYQKMMSKLWQNERANKKNLVIR